METEPATPTQALGSPPKHLGFKKLLLILILFVVAAGGWLAYYRDHKALVKYQKKELALRTLQKAAEPKTQAVFVRLEGSILYFKVASEVTTPEGRYVNYYEKIGTVTPTTKIFRAGFTDPKIQSIKANTQIALDMTADPKKPGQYIIEAIYVTE